MLFYSRTPIFVRQVLAGVGVLLLYGVFRALQWVYNAIVGG